MHAHTRRQVDQWLDTSSQLVSGSGFEGLCSALDIYLSLRSFFVGYGTTAADLAIWGQLQGERGNAGGRANGCCGC